MKTTTIRNGKIHRRIYLMVLLFCFNLIAVQAQANCKVKLETISSEYKGECNRGFAHGEGEAIGESDSYKGSFKKGLPHGTGVYAWGNGNRYEGNFVKGKMDGKGNLILNSDDGTSVVKNGYFKKGKYIGKYKNPYSVISKREIKSVYIQEDHRKNTGVGNEIRIRIKYNGSYVNPTLNITDKNGSNVFQRDGMTILSQVRFPVTEIEVSFTHKGFSCRSVFNIFKEGNWIVEITI